MNLLRSSYHKHRATTMTERRSHTAKRTWVIFILVCAVFAAGTASYVLRVTTKNSAAFYSYFSGLALIVMAFLTAVYTALLYEELALSHQQLDEMSRQREHQEQPVVMILDCTCRLQQPHAWPQAATKSGPFFGCILVPEFSVKNVGNGPAITLDASTALCVRSEGDHPLITHSVGQRLAYLSSNETRPDLSGYFFLDQALPLMHGLLNAQGTTPCLSDEPLESGRLHPLLYVELLYRGAAGGCFLGHFTYGLHVCEEDVATLKEWYKTLSSVEVDYGADLRRIGETRKSNPQKADEICLAVTRSFNSRMEDRTIELALEPAPVLLAVDTLSESQYREQLKNVQYGRLVAPHHHADHPK